MPRGEQLPGNRVSWRLEPGRAALLIHDMQRYFIDYYDKEASPVVEMLANIQKLRRLCASRGIPVVYTMQPAEQTAEQRGLLLDFWGPGLTAHPHKQEIVHELAPDNADTVLTKWRYSAFQRTDLLGLLREWRRDQLIICGVYAHIGCLMTAGEAFMNDVQPFFVADATSDFSWDMHKMAITYVAERCGVAVSTRDVADMLDGDLAGAALRGDAPASPQHDGSPDRAVFLELLRGDLAELLQLPAPEISEHEHLLDLGLDSIRLMSLVERLRGRGFEASFVELAERPTLADWCSMLTSR